MRRQRVYARLRRAMGARLRAVRTTPTPMVGTAHATERVQRSFIVRRAPLPTLRALHFFDPLFSISHSSSLLFGRPQRGAGGAPIGARMLRLHPDACMTARGLSLSRREPSAGATRRRASRRSTVTFFGPGPALYYRCSLDQAAMAALWGRASRDAGRCPPRCGGKPLRGRHTLLGLSGSPLEDSPHEQS